MIPKKPKTITAQQEAAIENFINGEQPITKNKTTNKDKTDVKMYNLPMPKELHATAKYKATLKGQTLLAYILEAIEEKNSRSD